MAYSARILLDSLSPSGSRLTTFELSYPRFVHAELMTHRQLSRNSASSRAIPVEKTIQRVIDDPAVPVWWGRNQAGMQAREELTGGARIDAEVAWLRARDSAVAHAEVMLAAGAHKQIVNRLLEPWFFITVIVSATEWANFFALRDHPDAQPEIAWVAREMARLYRESVPEEVDEGGWHLPLLTEEERDGIECPAGLSLGDAIKVSVGRCARVSYLTHDGRRDPGADIALHDRLCAARPGHWSPFEHVAQAMGTAEPSGNFKGWRQYRKMFADECVGSQLAVGAIDAAEHK